MARSALRTHLDQEARQRYLRAEMCEYMAHVMDTRGDSVGEVDERRAGPRTRTPSGRARRRRKMQSAGFGSRLHCETSLA